MAISTLIVASLASTAYSAYESRETRKDAEDATARQQADAKAREDTALKVEADAKALAKRKDDDRKRRTAQFGRQGTFATGRAGLQTQANTAGKRLLGE